MIDSREQLIHVLTEAAEVEHNLLCSYLYAVFSLKRAGEPGLSERQGEAVERWRKAILSIALQEMAHLACVNNLLLAVGGAPHFDRPNLPVAPGYLPAKIMVRLTPFDAATLDHFIFLERPDAAPLSDAEGFKAEKFERSAHTGRLTPSALDYQTIGELYDALAEGFARLSSRLGEAVLISPLGDAQLDSDVVRLPDVPRIVNLAGALSAIEHIKEEGEGSTGGREESHFDRFQAIKAEWAHLSREEPAFEPAWPAAHDPVMRKPLDEATRVWVDHPESAACLDLGNALYGAMLAVLGQAFGGAQIEQAKALMNAGVELMEACAAIGTALARMPASERHPGVNAGLSFAVPRNLGLRPTGSRSSLLERLGELQSGAVAVLQGVTLEKVERRLAKAVELLGPASYPTA